MGWEFEDLESGVSMYEFCIGLSSTTCDIVNFTDPGVDSKGNLINLVTLNLSLHQGTKYYGRVRAYNNAGLNVSYSSSGVTVDITPPLPGVVNITLIPTTTKLGIAIFNDPTVMAINWSGFSDPESDVAYYGKNFAVILSFFLSLSLGFFFFSLLLFYCVKNVADRYKTCIR